MFTCSACGAILQEDTEACPLCEVHGTIIKITLDNMPVKHKTQKKIDAEKEQERKDYFKDLAQLARGDHDHETGEHCAICD